MKRPNDDRASLWDMREAALEATTAIENVALETFLADNIRIRAIERLIEIVGEAANRVTREFRESHEAVPWAKIIGQRHILAHEYEEIDPKRLYYVVRDDLPTLIIFLDSLGLEPSLRERCSKN